MVATAKKLGVNVYHYLLDRVSGKNEMVSLAQAITNKATHSGNKPNLYYPSERSRECSHLARTKHKTSASLSPPKPSRAKAKVGRSFTSLSFVMNPKLFRLSFFLVSLPPPFLIRYDFTTSVRLFHLLLAPLLSILPKAVTTVGSAVSEFPNSTERCSSSP